MAVKIICTAPDKSVVKEVICRNCGCKLEYVPMDVKERHGKDYSGGAAGCKLIDCPNCEHEVILESW